MNDFRINCPNCNQSLEVPGEMLGQTIDCPACKQRIILPRPQLQQPAPHPVLAVSRNADNMSRPVQTSPGSIWSLVLGIISFTCFGPLTAIPAVICGHVALSRIKKSAGTRTGSGMAIAGLVLGYVNLGLMIVLIPMWTAIAIPSFMRARTTSQANACINNLRQIEAAKDQYALENGMTNNAAITFSDIGPNAKGDGFLKEWPVCPASPDANAETRTQSETEKCYDINVIGQNVRCRIIPDKHALK